MTVQLFFGVALALTLAWIIPGAFNEISRMAKDEGKDLKADGLTTLAGGMSLATLAFMLLNASVFAGAQLFISAHEGRWLELFTLQLGTRWDDVTLCIYSFGGAAVIQWIRAALASLQSQPKKGSVRPE